MQRAVGMQSMVSIMIQRVYAYAILFLREVFYASPNNRRYKWKALSTLVGSQVFLVTAAAMALATATDWFYPLLYPPAVLALCGAVLGVALYWGNLAAERRVLPRFEREFNRLSRRRRILGRVAVILYVTLSIAAFLGSAAAGHAKLCSIAPNIAIKC